MHTRHPAAEIAEERLDWFTYDIEPDGTQICAVRSARRRNDGVVLDRRASQLLQLLLNEIAQDNTIPFQQASGRVEGSAQSAQPAPSHGLITIRFSGIPGW